MFGAGFRIDTLNSASMPRIGTIEERFQAHNVEMLEVTGDRFWKSYKGMQNGDQQAVGLTSNPVQRRRA